MQGQYYHHHNHHHNHHHHHDRSQCAVGGYLRRVTFRLPPTTSDLRRRFFSSVSKVVRRNHRLQEILYHPLDGLESRRPVPPDSSVLSWNFSCIFRFFSKRDRIREIQSFNVIIPPPLPDP
mmetsp:Transcript_58153/g.142177  ORF Transcript_58153/g.142177 Transcript_58153/m.142177 type:complete len:121 (-) Transcript_58153:208-570(-)